MSEHSAKHQGRFEPLESLAAMRHEFGEHGGVNMSIEASTTFTVLKAGTLPDMFQGRLGPETGGCYLYGRHFNPTVYVLGRELAALEGAEAAYGTASGMSAVTAVVMQCCSPGDRIVASNTLYGGTYALFHDFLPLKAKVETTFVDISDLAAVEAACRDGVRLLYVESMSNPTLVVADIPRLAEIAHRHGAKLVVDNTFSPLILSPIPLGADIAVHSVTKFINGASDIIAGAICGTHEFISSLMDLHTGALMLMGPTMDPRVAFEISLRLPHLGLRMAEHSRRALLFSERLANRGMEVVYPGLTTHPQHELLKSLAHPDFGYGGLLSLDLKTTARAYHLMELLQNKDRFGYIAVSLGYFDTLMSCSASSTSSEMTSEDLQNAGISPGLVRISVGYTGSIEQRWKQFEDALDELERAPASQSE
jgi:methionine-gamma-lyase